MEQAVTLLHAQEAWLAEHRAEIRAKIDEGFAQAGRGELLDEGAVRARISEKKRAWSAGQRGRTK